METLMANEKQIKVLFTPMNSVGHLNGCFGLAEKLLKVGCHVSFMTIGKIVNKPKFADEIEFIELNINDPLYDIKTINEAESNKAVSQSSKDNKDDKDDNKSEIKSQTQEEKAAGTTDVIASFIEKRLKLTKLEYTADIIKFSHYYSAIDAEKNDEAYKKNIDQVKPDVIIVDRFIPPPSMTSNTIPWVEFLSANPLSILEAASQDQPIPLPFAGSKHYTKQQRAILKKEKPDEWQALMDSWTNDWVEYRKLFPMTDSAWNKYAKQIGASEVQTQRMFIKSPFLTLYMYPKVLDYRQDDDLYAFEDNMINCEACLSVQDSRTPDNVIEEWTEKLKELKSRPGNASKPVCLFSLGTLACSSLPLMEKFVSYMADDCDHLYVINKGINGDKLNLPSDNMIGASWLPQIFVLQNANIAIIHGGNNSTTETLFWGLPLIVMDVFGDQGDNAQRIEDLGLGKRLDILKSTKDEFLTAVKSISSDQSLIKRAKEIGETMRNEDSCLEGAKTLVAAVRNKIKQ